MQQPTATATSPANSSFASLLAALASPAHRSGASDEESVRTGQRFSSAGNDDGLEDDIATLSYERALRAHARYRTANQPLSQGAESGPIGFEANLPLPSTTVSQPSSRSATSAVRDRIAKSTAEPDPELHRCRETPFERNLKSASITIRLSKTECAQLHRRAADAGLTVSAYLRSCTFEAESLRAMVKDTMAELRLTKAKIKLPDPEPARPAGIRRVTEWLVRLLSPWHGNQSVARA